MIGYVQDVKEEKINLMLHKKVIEGGNIITKVELLKRFAKGWFGNSQQHSIHAQILAQRGFKKLAD